MSGRGPVVVAAGGTGGHLFPAAALSHALAARGFEVHLVTDERAAKFGGDFPAHAIHKVAAATPSGGSLFSRATAIFTLNPGNCCRAPAFQTDPPARGDWLWRLPDRSSGAGGDPASRADPFA